MMHQAYSKFTPLLDVPLGDGSSSKWFLGPWGRDDYMKQLQDFKRSKAFSPIESSWEKSCAEHLLKMYEQCVLTWVINKSKDQNSFGTEATKIRYNIRKSQFFRQVDAAKQQRIYHISTV